MQVSNQNQTNFKGLFQGIIVKGEKAHALPRTPMPSCPYADRLMSRIVYRALKSDKYQSKLDIMLKDTPQGKSLVFEMSPKAIKKLIPLKIKVLPKESSDLPNPKFWNILRNKTTSKIRYILPQEDYQKMVSYFNEPKTVTEKITRSVEDSSIVKKAKRLKTALMNSFQQPQDQKWLGEYFSGQPQ